MSTQTFCCLEDFRDRFAKSKAGNSEGYGPEVTQMAELMKGCPCTSLMSDPKRTFRWILTGAGILFSITLVGWILGILAFFRTF